MEGGCQVPVGALATVRDGTLRLEGLVASLDGARIVRARGSGRPEDAERIGCTLADELLSRGGEAILDDVRAAAAADPGSR